MGTWGYAVLSDDTASDVYADYMERFNRGQPHATILRELRSAHAESLDDPDDGPVVWLALAKAQWDCGVLEAGLLRRVENLVASGAGLERWREAGAATLRKRQQALQAFVAKLKTDNPRPRKPRKAVRGKPLFSKGDCVAIKLTDGDYGAVLILAHEPPADSAEPIHGCNAVILLKYKSKERPTLEVFERREWMMLQYAHGVLAPEKVWLVSAGARAFKPKLELVGRIELRPDDPRPGGGYARWEYLEHFIINGEWVGKP